MHMMISFSGILTQVQGAGCLLTPYIFPIACGNVVLLHYHLTCHLGMD
jgi:hypothetical protein